MNGANALIRTLTDSGVDVCFANPGTSEMHFVAALDDVPEMRSVLALFEGVATGAADGYARMAGRPAATLLHLGSGLSNGLAHLHNARRAHTPVVNIVGDHATYHKRYDAPLDSDMESIARGVSSWIRTSLEADKLASDTAEAVSAAVGPPGQVATLILPADVSWSETTTGPSVAGPAESGQAPETAAIEAAAAALRSGEHTALLIGGRVAASESLLAQVAAVSTATGAKLLCETFPARLQRGAGRPPVERLSYLAEFAEAQMAGLSHLVILDTKSPVSFFAYPDRASDLVPEECTVHTVASPASAIDDAISALVEATGSSGAEVIRQQPDRPAAPSGALDAESLAQAIGATLPEDAIVIDEGNTSGLFVSPLTAGAPVHDWLCLTGGAIGFGPPLATGAAIACPDRKVLCLESDGAFMYSSQALWTQAREGLDVVTVVCNNRSYAVLNMELSRVGATAGGDKAKAMLDLSKPELDFVSLARSVGVPASRADTAEELTSQLQRAYATGGPHLIEAVVPPLM